MKNRILFFFILLLGISLSNCAIQDVDLVRVNDVSLNENILTGAEPKLTVNVTLNNPNKFNIKVKKAKINININGNDAGNIGLDEIVLVEKLKEGDYNFVLIGDKEKIMQAVTSSAINIALTGKVNVTIKGWVKGKAFGLGKKIKVDEKKSFSTKDLGIQ